MDRIMNTLLVAIVLFTVGYIFINNSLLGYTESAILYLATVVGAGFYWLGINLKNK